LRSAQLKLDLEKCVFGGQKGKVLCYLVSLNGIEANPNKINAILHMKPLQSRKEVQRVTGRIAALNWFMAKLAEQSIPFFTALRGSEISSGGQSSRQLSMH
jgi:hypothetical protein